MQKKSLLSNKPWIFFAIWFPVTIITFHPGFRFRILTILLTIASSNKFYHTKCWVLNGNFFDNICTWNSTKRSKFPSTSIETAFSGPRKYINRGCFAYAKKIPMKNDFGTRFWTFCLLYIPLFPWPFKNYRLAAKCKSFNFNTQKNISCDGKKRL